MIGIYCFTNKINNKKYVGQSINIEDRYKNHKYNYKKGATSFYKAIQEYGWNNFYFEVLEECLSEELNEKERYWIEHLNSFKNGYNLTTGSQGEHYEVKEESRLKHSGENHPFSVLTEDDVFNIREYRLQGLKRLDVYEKYKNKISLKGFQHIWQGDRWTFVHMDVYEVKPVNKKPKIPKEVKEKIVEDIGKISKAEIARKYGVSYKTVQRLGRGEFL